VHNAIERPNEPPEKIGPHHIAEQHVDAFQRDFASNGESQRVIIEDPEARPDEPKNREHIDPMEPAREGIPRQILLVLKGVVRRVDVSCSNLYSPSAPRIAGGRSLLPLSSIEPKRLDAYQNPWGWFTT
jgi:hypothetical protein